MRHSRQVLFAVGSALIGAAAVTAAVVAADALPSSWLPFDGGPDATCADGSDPLFLERPADPERVVFYLEGGGACFSTETCAFDGPESTYVSSSVDVSGWLDDRGGIFDAGRAENPVAGYSFVYVPYCTGDAHLGTVTREYAPDLVVEHKGFVNAMAALEHLTQVYPDATEVVVAGASAGSIPTPLFGALVADRLPGARVVTLSDSSGAYPDNPLLSAYLGSLWGTGGAIPDWPETAGIGLVEWNPPALYAFAEQHAPGVTYARFDYADDEAQAFYAALVGVDAADLLALIDENEATAEAAGAKIASYVAPGEAHTLIGDDAFYELEVDGVRFRDWFADLVAGASPGDVHCHDCGGRSGS